MVLLAFSDYHDDTDEDHHNDDDHNDDNDDDNDDDHDVSPYSALRLCTLRWPGFGSLRRVRTWSGSPSSS